MAVSEFVKKSFPTLIVLQENCGNKILRDNLLKKKEVICVISEIVHNILHQVVPVTNRQKAQLKKYKRDLFLIANKGKKQEEK